MNEDIKIYLNKYPTEIIILFEKLRQTIIENVSVPVEEKMWAKLPTYYLKESFVRLIPFKDHINIEATGIVKHKDKLTDFKITPKGMLQIFLKQDIHYEILKIVFTETLLSQNS